jgi:hypothetical protein
LCPIRQIDILPSGSCTRGVKTPNPIILPGNETNLSHKKILLDQEELDTKMAAKRNESAASTPPRKTRRMVHFASRVQGVQIIHINNMTEDEIRSTWYQQSEMQAIKTSLRTTIETVEAGESMDSEELCIRGLELQTTEVSKKRRKFRRQSIRKVLKEQDRQRNEDCFDDESLAGVYCEYSCPCQEVAHEAAVKDELDVREQEMKSSSSITSTIPKACTPSRAGQMIDAQLVNIKRWDAFQIPSPHNTRNISLRLEKLMLKTIQL